MIDMINPFCQLCGRNYANETRLVQHVNVVHGSNWNGVTKPWQAPQYVIDEEPDVPTLLCS